MQHPCALVSLNVYVPSGRMRSKPVWKKIGEQSDAQRCKAAESVQRLYWNRGERIVREYLGEASRGKIVRHRQPKQLRNADPAERRNPPRLTRIGVECPFGQQIEIGRASCRERVCQYV